MPNKAPGPTSRAVTARVTLPFAASRSIFHDDYFGNTPSGIWERPLH